MYEYDVHLTNNSTEEIKDVQQYLFQSYIKMYLRLIIPNTMSLQWTFSVKGSFEVYLKKVKS